MPIRFLGLIEGAVSRVHYVIRWYRHEENKGLKLAILRESPLVGSMEAISKNKVRERDESPSQTVSSLRS
jgi:hypothetical protein